MLKELRKAIEARGLPSEASTAEAETFYAALSLEEKGHVGTELGREGYVMPGREPLMRREEPVELTIRSMQVRAQTANEQEHSIEATISTDAAVEVYDYLRGERIEEVLLGSGAELPGQLPLLETHSRWSLESVLGSARGLRTEDGNVVGRLYFAKGDAPAEQAWNKVRQGHLTDVSVGYRVIESVEIQPGQSATVAGRQYNARRLTLRIATKWAPREVSLVPIGADPAAKMREHNPLFLKGNTMPPKLRAYLEQTGLRADASEAEAWAMYRGLSDDLRIRADEAVGEPVTPPADPPADRSLASRPADPPASPSDDLPSPDAGRVTLEIQAAIDTAVADDRLRANAVTALAGDDVPDAVRQDALDRGLTPDQAAPLFLGAVRTARQSAGGSGGPAIHVRDHDRDCNVRSMAAGLLMGQGLDPTKGSLHRGDRDPRRADALTEQDADRGEEFRNLSAYDLVRECALVDTGRHYRDPSEAFRAAMSGATLNYVFTTNVYAQLLAGWETVGDTTVGWCDEEDVPNFLTQEDISLEAQARLKKLPRGDTAKHATASDTRETYKIARFARQFVADEQDFIDDRLGAIMRMPGELGEAARQLRPDLVYSLMLQNPTMADTGQVFNATAVTTAGGHANQGTGALASGTLKTAISAMVKQRLKRTATDPGRALTIRPKFLHVPAELEWTARSLTASAALAKLFADSSDPWYSQLNLIAQEGIRVVVDDRIGAIGVLDPNTETARTGTDANWFLSSGGKRGVRVAYRRGTGRRPVMRSFVLDKGQWGLGWDINLDLAAVFTEYRTWYKSTGAA